MEKSELTQEGAAVLTPHTRFARHARAVGVLWGVFSICFCIIAAVVFIQPHWIGAPADSTPGHMGLWRWCSAAPQGEVTCSGQLQDLTSFTRGVTNTPFRAATALTGLAVVTSVLSVLLLLLFLCVQPSRVFHLAGWMQILSGCLLGAAVCVYPLGFSSSEVRHLCGPSSRHYNLGDCSVRWAYVLAIIGVFDGIVLAALALVLATRTVKPGGEYLRLPPAL